MKAAIVSPYFSTMGGGERYALTVGEFLLSKGWEVDVFSEFNLNAELILDRFGLFLKKARFVPNIFKSKENFLGRLLKTHKYDLMFFLSDGSVPFSLARKNILHFQSPLEVGNQKTLANAIKFRFIDKVVCNSAFTKKFIDSDYGIKSEVLYPPVDIESFRPKKKENIILGVGRFFAPSNPKKQETLIDTFKKIHGKKPDWSLVLIGGATLGTNVDDLRKKSRGFPIKIITDAPVEVLRDYYGRSKLFWHAAGFGENLETKPARAEHFGMSTVEAMAAGCVPLVFSGGGQPEIIEEEKTGWLWVDPDELEVDSLGLIDDPELLVKLSRKAVIRAKNFSKDKFTSNLSRLLELE